jgi:hypothetical protein
VFSTPPAEQDESLYLLQSDAFRSACRIGIRRALSHGKFISVQGDIEH